MKKLSKSLQKTDRPKRAAPLSTMDRVKQMDPAMQLHIAQTINTAQQPEVDRRRGRVASYKRLLQAGNATERQQIIETAHGNALADQAVREYIAEMIDHGRQHELSSQLNAYAIMCLVHPMQIMRRRDD
jgi:hypothetical protein